MSLSTRTGDGGNTGLMYNRRVAKTHPQVEACGAVDELSATLGVARTLTSEPWVEEQIYRMQKDLVALMGELAVAAEDHARYAQDKYPKMSPETLARLDAGVLELESQDITFTGWATPGGTPLSAALDVARTVCRRAERSMLRAREEGALAPDLAFHIMNRLSDFLWLLARRDETLHPPPARTSE